MQQQQPPPSSLSLPPGWLAVMDPSSSRVYYANPSTGQTSWEPPVAIAPPPPSPAMPVAPPQPSPPPPPLRFNELESLSAGMIADMCRVEDNRVPYTPLESHLISAQPPRVEEGRLEIRLATLENQLKRQKS